MARLGRSQPVSPIIRRLILAAAPPAGGGDGREIIIPGYGQFNEIASRQWMLPGYGQIQEEVVDVVSFHPQRTMMGVGR